MQPLGVALVGLAHVDGLVIEERIGADQAPDDAVDLRHPEHAPDGGRVGIALREGRSRGLTGDAVAIDLGDDGAVDLLRHDLVEPQHAAGHELGHLSRVEQVLLVHHQSISSSFSKMNSFFWNEVVYSVPG